MLMNPEETCPTCLEFSSPCRLPIAPESSLHPGTLLGLSSRTHSWTRSRSPPGADVGANPPSFPWHWATVCNIWGYRIFAYFYEDFLQGGAWHLFRKPGSLQKLNQRVSLVFLGFIFIFLGFIFIRMCQTLVGAFTNLISLNPQSSSLK